MTRIGLRSAGLVLAALFALEASATAFAWVYRNPPGLGPSLALGEIALYPPWAVTSWRHRFPNAEQGWSAAASVFLLAFGVALAGVIFATPAARHRRVRGWGTIRDAARLGLRRDAGCVLGEMDGRMLTTDDLRPTLVTGGTRAGKGRGHVIPTLLSWTDSVLVHDPKGELWRETAGWRATFSYALYFSPRRSDSARFNPLAEIRTGPGALAQIQRLVAILSDPGGARDDEAIWDKAASEILEAVILHVLYTAPDADKTLLTVRTALADLDRTAEAMARTLHREDVDGRLECDPFIAVAVKGYAAMHDRFRTSVQGTARSYLKWLAGADLERSLSASDFSLGDLMCADRPVSLYVQVAPADAAALRPLVRLLFYAAAQALTADEKADASGLTKQRPLLMVMDEFPLLGRLAFFEKSLRLMSGYGIKTLLVAQSLNDIVETYGPHNTILDNCHVYTAFSALDPLTQEKVSKLTGTVLETRTSRSGPSGLAAGRSSISRSEVERPLLEPGEVRALADDVQLTFVAGGRPLRTRKLRYDQRRPFNVRAGQPAPDQSRLVDTPRVPLHPWTGRRKLGEDAGATLPLFKEVEAAIHERRIAAGAVKAYEARAAAFAEGEACLDGLQGLAGGSGQ